MATEQTQPLVSYLGVVLQLAGSALLAMMFFMLRRYAQRRPYFATWSVAWLALVVACGALVLGQMPGRELVDAAGAIRGRPGLALAWVCYVSNATFIVLLAAGANQFARGTVQRRWLAIALPAVGLFALAALLRNATLPSLMRWHAPVAIAGFGWSAIRLGSLPLSRQGIGTHLSGSVFALLTLLWALYLIAYSHLDLNAGRVSWALSALVDYQSFINLLLYVLLGYGMVLLLMEQAKREVDDANAELAVAHSAMRRAALYDSLTGCLNRRAFDEGVGMDNARGGFGAVMMFDLDDLKDVNDAYGHSAGDTLLRHLTGALRAELRPSDKLYRWGGDEFLLLLPGADEARARQRLRTVLGDVAVLHLGPNREPVRLNVSMGSAPYASAEQIRSAVDAADAMMYREKARKKALRVSES